LQFRQPKDFGEDKGSVRLKPVGELDGNRQKIAIKDDDDDFLSKQ
jgi:hypothetical protein